MATKSNIAILHTGQAGRPKRAKPGPYLPLPSDFPPPPGLTQSATELWNHFIPLLAGRGDVSVTDLAALEMFVRAYAGWRANRGRIEADGDLVINDKGRAVTHPLRYSITGDEQLLTKLFVQLRLVPKARDLEPEGPANGAAISVDF
jgi:phage terminase small subunit